MAGEIEQLTLKLTIDGKEAILTLDTTEQKVRDLAKAMTGAGRQPMLQQFAKELLSVDASSAEAVSGITEFIRTNQLTEKEISQVIQALQQEKGTLAAGSAEWQAHNNAINNLNGAYAGIIGRQNNFVGGAPQVNRAGGMMTQTMGQLGYAIGDADMFFINFRMGMMSVANNIPMVAQGFMYAANAAKVAGTTIKAELLASLAGPGGLLLAVNGLMFLLNVLPQLFASATKEIKEQKEEIDKLKESYKEFSKATLENMKVQTESEIFQLQNKGGLGARSKGEALFSWILSSDLSDKEKERLKILYQQKAALAGQLEQLGELDNIKKRIGENEKAYYGVSK